MRTGCAWMAAGAPETAASAATGGSGGWQLFDAHSHVHLGEGVGGLEERVSMAVMGTRPQDWDAVEALAAAHPGRVVPCFGVHPWYAHEVFGEESGGGWVDDLRARLARHPRAAVGEIGLDGQWVPPGLDGVQSEAQRAVFETQLALAVELQRPVSMHCVKAYGEVFDSLRKQGSPAQVPVYFHSFGGKEGMLDSLLKMKPGGPASGGDIYFGFSAAVNLRSPKTRAVMAAVPDERILLESDLEGPSADVQADLAQMLGVIAEAKGWSEEEAARVTTANARRFYSLE